MVVNKRLLHTLISQILVFSLLMMSFMAACAENKPTDPEESALDDNEAAGVNEDKAVKKLI